MLVGDADGLIAIPSATIVTVAETAGKLSHTESEVRRDIANGLLLLAALARYATFSAS